MQWPLLCCVLAFWKRGRNKCVPRPAYDETSVAYDSHKYLRGVARAVLCLVNFQNKPSWRLSNGRNPLPVTIDQSVLPRERMKASLPKTPTLVQYNVRIKQQHNKTHNKNEPDEKVSGRS